MFISGITEALPEILIACIIAAVVFYISKGRVRDEFRKAGVGVFIACLIIVIIMLGQSNSVPERLNITENPTDYDKPLSDVVDSSPAQITAEQSSERLEAMREEQKQDTVLGEKDSESDSKEDDQG
ncbi:MAG: hypothetical protein ACFHVJ_09085 [Aestuariibacter sp.]